MTHPLHPLTDEKAAELIAPELIDDWIQRYPPCPIEDAMRLGADWQLEQDIEHLKHALLNWVGPSFNDEILDDFKKAMRPTTQENS